MFDHKGEGPRGVDARAFGEAARQGKISGCPYTSPPPARQPPAAR
jgi:hypothetical protein